MSPHQHTRLAASALGVITTAGLAATIPFWANTQPARAAGGYHDAAYGIAASGAAPISARPSVSSTNGSTHSGSGGASSSDGTISISSASVLAGGGKASARVSGFSAFDGLVTASTVTATCSNGSVSSSASGTSASLGKNGSVAYDVHVTNSDGSTTVIGMQVHIATGHGTEAATISIASATCAKAPATAPHAHAGLDHNAHGETDPHRHPPADLEADGNADRDDEYHDAAAADQHDVAGTGTHGGHHPRARPADHRKLAPGVSAAPPTGAAARHPSTVSRP